MTLRQKYGIFLLAGAKLRDEIAEMRFESRALGANIGVVAVFEKVDDTLDAQVRV